jgi:plasmid maintenance system antidote protein VapI
VNLQQRWDLYHAQQAEARQLEIIRPYVTMASAAG